MIRRMAILCLLWAVLGQARHTSGQSTQPAAAQPAASQPAAAQIKLQIVIEEKKKMIQATVTAGGKPVENANVSFQVRRTFGNLLLGQDKTLDDGTAEVAYPLDLPGSPDGQFHLIAAVISPSQYASARLETDIPASMPAPIAAEPFPRALWAPRAPFLLIATIVVVLAAVWCTYAYVVFQLYSISRGR